MSTQPRPTTDARQTTDTRPTTNSPGTTAEPATKSAPQTFDPFNTRRCPEMFQDKWKQTNDGLLSREC